MRLDVTDPRTRKRERALFVLRAGFNAKPGKERKAMKRARRAFDQAFPKEGRAR